MNERLSVDSALCATCVGIIMDGNRRWAKKYGMTGMEGHAAGLKKAKEIVRHAFSSGIETVILYAFSTENWNRSPGEVSYLMNLFGGVLMRDLNEISRKGVRVRFVGDLALLPEKLRMAAIKLERKSIVTNSGKTLNIAISYGGRAEILAAVNRLLKMGKEEVQEKDISAALWSSPMRDPDLVIRTGGGKRLSNFLLWQSAYSEFFFSDSFWPDFSCQEFDAILAEFSVRERRYGK